MRRGHTWWQAVPDLCRGHGKGAVTNSGKTCRWDDERWRWLKLPFAVFMFIHCRNTHV